MLSIIFYDIPSIHPKVWWSPNSCKSRFLLNYLDIPYETEYVTYDELTPTFKAIGCPENPSYPPYWVPTIQLEDNTFIASSENILEHFDSRYHEKLFPTPEYEKFSKEFMAWYLAGDHKFANYRKYVILPFTENILTTPACREYFHVNKGRSIGRDLTECRENKDDIKKYSDDAFYFLTMLKEEFPGYEGFDRERFATGKYLYGDEICYADLFFLATVVWAVHVSEAQDVKFFKWTSVWLKNWYDDLISKVGTV